jgi:hypothetical protein
VDVTGISPVPLVANRAKGLTHQQFGKSDDRVERRSQFVTHEGEEVALGLIGVGRS